MLTPDQIRDLPRGEYAFPGEARDALVGAILRGEKTSTTSLAEAYRREGERFPVAGDLEAVVDSDDEIVCVTRAVDVQVVRLGAVPLHHVIAEGEGFETVEAWRSAHERFWTSPEFVAELGEPAVPIDDDTEVVCESFEVVGRRERA